ncbi:DoxX family protein [Actinomadura sp. 9N407]|uniref:DoxX family protein n=1 Tax=Actinomadura sp. 9N407 TaxID=3375154 RepID=UPI00379A262F
MPRPERFGDPMLALFRMVVGLLFTIHGAASLFGVLGGNRGTGKAVEFAVWPGWWAALIQLVCGLLVLTGLFTRIGATLASGSMAYAYFVVHQPRGLLPHHNEGELAAMFCWAFLLIAVLGPGAWALDAHRSRRRADERGEMAGQGAGSGPARAGSTR